MKNREIAARIRAGAPNYPTQAEYEAKHRMHRYAIDVSRAVFVFGTLKLECFAYQEAVLSMAKKFERNSYSGKHGRPQRGTMARPADADALLSKLQAEFTSDGAKAAA
jgi:hypothetical protein